MLSIANIQSVSTSLASDFYSLLIYRQTDGEESGDDTDWDSSRSKHVWVHFHELASLFMSLYFKFSFSSPNSQGQTDKIP